MILFALTVFFCILATVLMIYGTSKYGWTNFNIIPIAMVLASLTFGVVGFLA